MAYTDPFLLGPLGAMTRLPGVLVSEGVEREHIRLAGEHHALNGRTTIDVWSVRGTWLFSWPLARADAARRLVTRFRGTSRATLRLLDPIVPNLLPFDASVCGAESRTPTHLGSQPFDEQPWGFHTAGTALLELPGLDVPAPLVGDVDAVARWIAPASGGAIEAATPGWQRVPILGRAVTFSAYVRGSGAVLPRLAPINAAGLATTSIGPAQTTTLTGTWQRVSATIPAGRTEPSCYPMLVTGAAASLQTTGWQVEHATTPSAWSPGWGAPEVEIVEFTDSYRALGRRAVTLKLREV